MGTSTYVVLQINMTLIIISSHSMQAIIKTSYSSICMYSTVLLSTVNHTWIGVCEVRSTTSIFTLYNHLPVTSRKLLIADSQ